jgi:glycosyltransferase involved in cell wall biosynthesis
MGHFFYKLLTEDYDQWDRFVDQSLQGEVFCYSWWLDAITKGNFKILTVCEGNEIVAGIPLAYYLGKINEPPLTRTLGPLFKDLSPLPEHDRVTMHRKWLKLLIDQIAPDEFEQFCTSPYFTDWLPFRWQGFKQDTRYTYIIHFKNKSSGDLWKLLNQNRRRDLAKAEKNNLKIEIIDDLKLLYDLTKLTYQRQNLTFNFAFPDFKELDEALRKKDQRRIFAVFNEKGQAIAAVYIAFNEKSANYLIGGTDPDFYNLGAPTLALWEAINYFQNKVSRFNFCGSNIENIETYFRGFGGELTPYFHLFSGISGVHEKQQMLVTVVTACYNHGKFIPELLESVLNQSYQNIEVIIVNDGSTDDTADILDRITHKKVRVIHTENSGPSNARNLAIKHARGEIIFNLDADNKIGPTLIEKCVAVFNTHPNTGIVYSDLVYFGYRTGPFVLPDYSLEEMLRANCIDASACFRRADWAKTEGYSAVFTNAYEDFDFWLSLLELGVEVYKIKEPLTFYRTYERAEDCRSERTKQDPDQVEEVIVQAFQRHKALYKNFPQIFLEFSERETLFNNRKKQKIRETALPVFSIITPTNNRPQLLIRAIESVLSQSFVNFEQIIVDDANNPEIESLVNSFKDKRLQYVSLEIPSGAGAAYNIGMKFAKGRFLNFLDDDDEYLPGILQKIYHAFETSPGNPGFIFTGITRVRDTEDGEEPIITQVWPADFETKEDGLTISTSIGNGYGFSIKRECIDAIGEYDTSLTTGQDTDFLIRLSKKFTFRTVPEVLVKIHHHHKNRLSDLAATTLRWNCYRTIMDRHFDFLSGHFKVIHIHSIAYLTLCYLLKNKNAGRKFMWKIVKKHPFKKILYQDLWCYELYGKDYQSYKRETINSNHTIQSTQNTNIQSIESTTNQQEEGIINVLSIGSGNSIFLAELYGRISHRSQNKIVFTIAGDRQFAEGMDCKFMDLIGFRNIYTEQHKFNFSLFRLVLKYLNEKENFRSLLSLRSELLFLAYKTDFNVRLLLKEIRQVLNKRYFGNTILRPIFDNYHVLHVQFLSQENIDFVWYISNSTKLIGTFWGSDLMRKSGMEDSFYLKKFHDHTSVFTAPSLEMREITLSKFGRVYYPKFKEIRFPLLDHLFTEIDNTKDVAGVRFNFLTSLGLDPNKKNIVVSHNGSRFNNHLPILKALKESDLIDLESYNIILPIGYFPDGTDYKSEIEGAVKDIPNCRLLENLYFGKDLAALRLVTDYLIHAPQSDALGATLVESIFAGAIPIVGSWLPYGNYDRFKIPLVRVDDFFEIPEKILAPEYIHTQQTKDNINKHLRSEHVLDQWIDIYKSLRLS